MKTFFSSMILSLAIIISFSNAQAGSYGPNAAISDLRLVLDDLEVTQKDLNIRMNGIRKQIWDITQRLNQPPPPPPKPAEGFFTGSSAANDRAFSRLSCTVSNVQANGKLKEAYGVAVANATAACRQRFASCEVEPGKTSVSFEPANIPYVGITPDLGACTISVSVRGTL